jgi:ketosteroid isomerase-like protein
MNETDPIRFVKEMDQCWLDRRFDDLRDHFADDVVMVSRGYVRRFTGADACVAGYRDFMEAARVQRFEPIDFVARDFDGGAVVEYRWGMDWESGAEAHTATGREILVLSRAAEGWRIVWRTQIPV